MCGLQALKFRAKREMLWVRKSLNRSDCQTGVRLNRPSPAGPHEESGRLGGRTFGKSLKIKGGVRLVRFLPVWVLLSNLESKPHFAGQLAAGGNWPSIVWFGDCGLPKPATIDLQKNDDSSSQWDRLRPDFGPNSGGVVTTPLLHCGVDFGAYPRPGGQGSSFSVRTPAARWFTCNILQPASKNRSNVECRVQKHPQKTAISILSLRVFAKLFFGWILSRTIFTVTTVYSSLSANRLSIWAWKPFGAVRRWKAAVVRIMLPF